MPCLLLIAERVRPSDRIKTEFEKCKEYYSAHGKLIVVPAQASLQPASKFLSRHEGISGGWSVVGGQRRIKQDPHHPAPTGGSRLRAANSSTAIICSRVSAERMRGGTSMASGNVRYTCLDERGKKRFYAA